MLVNKALYVLKCSSAAFRSHLSKILYKMGYKLIYIDLDL